MDGDKVKVVVKMEWKEVSAVKGYVDGDELKGVEIEVGGGEAVSGKLYPWDWSRWKGGCFKFGEGRWWFLWRRVRTAGRLVRWCLSKERDLISGDMDYFVDKEY